MIFFVSQKEFNRRIDICKQCPAYVPKLGMCMTCECFMHLKAKLSGSECPLHKWQKPLDKVETSQEPIDDFVQDFKDVAHVGEPDANTVVEVVQQENLNPNPQPFQKTDF